jgi:hypothetical protein
LLKAKYITYGAGWFLSLALLAVWSVSYVNSSAVITPIEFHNTITGKNHVGRFKLMHCDPEQNGKPSFFLSFDSLITENGDLGMFKTSLQRTLSIHGLKVGVYGYNSAEPEALLGFNDTADTKDVVKCGIEKFSRIFYEEDENTNYKIRPEVDFNNICKLHIIGFQFNRYNNDELSLEIKSQTAETVYGQSGLVLRGHVVIRANKNMVLECNHMVWDISKQTFHAKGIYALNQNGTVKTGKDIYLTINLNESIISQNRSENEKGNENVAQSYYNTDGNLYDDIDFVCSNFR